MLENIKRVSFKHKNNKLLYYVKNHIRYAFPCYSIYQKLLDTKWPL